MFDDYFSQKLEPGEKDIILWRRHPATFLLPFIKILIFGSIPFFFIKYLVNSMIGLFILGVWMIFSISYGFFEWFVWYFDMYIITNKRVIDIEQKSVFSRMVIEANLENIQDVYYEINGIFGTMLNYGTITVSTASSGKKITLDDISDPKHAQDLILERSKSAKMHHKTYV